MATVSGAQAVAEIVKRYSGGNFIKLQEDGASVVGAFLGDECAFEAVWIPSREVTEYYDPDKHPNLQPSLKILWNFWVPAEQKVMALPINGSTYSKIVACRDKYGLDTKLFEIVRHGAKRDTNTTYSVMPDADLTDDDRKAIKGVRLLNLEALARGDKEADATSDADNSNAGSASSASNASSSTSKPMTINDATAKALIGHLKELPRSKVDEFLTKFGIERIRDLNEGQLNEALAFIDEATGSSGERDPFA